MGREIKRFIIGSLISAGIHITIFSSPIFLTPALNVQEIPGSIEVSLGVQWQPLEERLSTQAKKTKQVAAKIADWVKVSVKKGIPDMKGKVFDAVIVRLKKPWRRNTGERVAFEDNAVTILKDERGNPKGTQIKGPIAREVQERWQQVAKIASVV